MTEEEAAISAANERSNRGDHTFDPVRLPLLDLVINRQLPVTDDHECPYLPDHVSRSEGFSSGTLNAQTYHMLMDLGFRRSGTVFYRPQCPSCEKCVPMRVPVRDFRASKSQRRAVKRNADVSVTVGRPALTQEKVDLYGRYLQSQHPGSPQEGDAAGLRDFLYVDVVDTREICYRDPAGRLLGVSIIDVFERAVSSVYHFFEPDEPHRSMGVFSVVREIEMTRDWGKPHYYLGYWIAGCATMDYKARYRPHELLMDGKWVRKE